MAYSRSLSSVCAWSTHLPTPGRPFFFSSRRRHTRSLCDWSSDVCSSDLPRRPDLVRREQGLLARHPAWREEVAKAVRSEERRVGKERRSPWRPEHYKNSAKRSRDRPDTPEPRRPRNTATEQQQRDQRRRE